MKKNTFFTTLLLLIMIVSFSALIFVEAAPIYENDTTSASENTPHGCGIELVSATPQGVVLQLTVSKSDFKINTHERRR